MKIITSKRKLIAITGESKNLGFVPTMGAIHKGHVSLVKKCASICNKTVVSIFINKAQFNKNIDYKKYPRVLTKDISILKKLKVDYLFIPSEKEIYPNGPNKKIKITSFSKKLCGKSRPGHFKAVVDVVDRFINIIKPNKIFFGNKDMQQLKIIEDFIRRNKIKTKVISCKTVRENNGIACSSRNSLLSNEEKSIASKVFKIIFKNKQNLINNKVTIINLKNKILNLGVNKIDYIKILNVNALVHPYKQKKLYKIFFAYYLKNTRLIDNI